MVALLLNSGLIYDYVQKPKGFFNEARQMFEEMIRLAPDSPPVYAVGAWAQKWGIFQNPSVEKARYVIRIKN